MKIVVLMEDTAGWSGLTCEHGLSLYIETERHRILFDMGRTNGYVENAQKLGVDLAAVDLAVLSHSHWDHSGGLKRFLELNQTAKVYVSGHAFEHCCNKGRKYNGLDTDLQDHERLCYVEDELWLDDEVSLFSCNQKERPFGTDSFGQTIRRGDEFLPDPYLHEQYLLINQGGKQILFSGCSHKGILNIAHWFAPDVLVGGFHFLRLDPEGIGKETLEMAANQLMQHPTVYYTAHCTGLKQYHFLKERMGERLHVFSTGEEILI